MKNYREILEENREFIDKTFERFDRKYAKVAARSVGVTADGVDESGRFYHRDPNHFGWTYGFFGGLNYLLYEYTKRPEYLTCAEACERELDKNICNYDELQHDLGFVWHLLSGAHYRISGDQDSRRRDLFMASVLFSRFIPSGGYIRAWNGEGNADWSIVDCLMNLPLLYFASDELGDDRFKQVAMTHADMTLLDHLREDGSIAHIVEHDRATGEVVKTYGGQGVREGSSWSRGQAWGLYGFVISYLHTGEQRYLDGAKQVANYFIANCCDDWLPRVDFRAPSEPVYYDSTAGCCAACGLIELAKALPEDEGGMYAYAAIQLLRHMSEAFADWDESTDSIMTHGTVRYPCNGDLRANGVHISIIYGDYFFAEALLKLKGSTFNPW